MMKQLIQEKRILKESYFNGTLNVNQYISRLIIILMEINSLNNNDNNLTAEKAA